MSIDGIFNVNKPPGWTSHQVVAAARRIAAQRRIGHGGTLDPEACGVLPLCLGQATRMVPYLQEASKTYLAEIEMGTATDTHDATGKVVSGKDPGAISQGQVEQVLGAFRGTIAQTPPMYSAVRHQGRRLYELARAGIEVERSPRPAHILSLELVEWQHPRFTVAVDCGKGTYVRSLAHDIGQALGCPSHLRWLVRQRCGPFPIEDSLSIAQLEDAFVHGYWQELIHPIDAVLEGWAAVIVSEEDERAISHGRPLALEGGEGGAGGRLRAYSLDGRFLAVLRFVPESGQWRPEKVFCGREGAERPGLVART